ncbi:efflux RND transporter periplasmic adaptor subunit [Nonomuraea mangrovi]|uniref:Efflux RND transporter periplasmic adaptor subunit n=1 Tax=Nonomuraea mangrovi TaxID=2316207 RepID=A0ABW4T0J8_9ACTN
MRPSHMRRGGLAVAAAALAGAGVLVVVLGDDPAPSSTVRLAAAQRGTVTASVSAAGSTKDGSRRDLAFGASGKVQGLKVKVGDKVRKGRVLAWTDATAAREAYAAAKADVAAAQDAVDTAASCSSAQAGVPDAAQAGGPVATAGVSDTAQAGLSDAAQAGGLGAGIALAAFTPVTPQGTPSPEPRGADPDEPEEPVPTVTVTVTEPAPTVTVTVTATPSAQVPAPRPTGDLGGIPAVTAHPTSAPDDGPAASPGPSAAASGRPTGGPSAKPSAKASGRPSAKPSAGTTGRPSARPSAGASGEPGRAPDGRPSPGPQASAGPSGQAKANCGMGEEQAGSALAKAQAAMEQAADAVRATRIVAPVSGTVLSVGGGRGDSVGTGTFISLGDLDELQVEAMFTESDVNSLALGQKAGVTLATRQGERHTGTVAHIAPTATATDRLVRYAVTVTFDDPPSGLLVGQSATVTVTTGEADDALYVPAQAVRTRTDGTATVTVKTAAGQKEQPVTTGVRGDQYVQIEQGLSDSDQVVLVEGGTGEFPDGSWPED